MAEFDYVGNPASFPTPKSNTNGSGSATFFLNSFQPLVDRTAWLKARADTQVGVSGTSVSRTTSGPALPISGTWTLQQTGLYTTAVNTACVLNIPISAADLPNGVTLTSASVSILPAAHASIAGLTLPTLALYSFDTINGLTQIGATTPDPSLNFGTYSLQHSITIGSISAVVDRTTKRYFMVLTTEFGGGAAAPGLLAVAGSVIYTAL